MVDRSAEVDRPSTEPVDPAAAATAPPPPAAGAAGAAAPWELAAARALAMCKAGRAGAVSDVILSQRGGQSAKPTELAAAIEALVPNGRWLELFTRPNNLRDGWVSIGNELCAAGEEVAVAEEQAA